MFLTKSEKNCLKREDKAVVLRNTFADSNEARVQHSIICDAVHSRGSPIASLVLRGLCCEPEKIGWISTILGCNCQMSAARI